MRVSDNLLSTPRVVSNSTRPREGGSFGQVLQESLQNVNQLQLEADEQAAQLVMGTATDLHQVMIAGEKAQLALGLTIAVRNKVIEAYQELSRMQI